MRRLLSYSPSQLRTCTIGDRVYPKDRSLMETKESGLHGDRFLACSHHKPEYLDCGTRRYTDNFGNLAKRDIYQKPDNQSKIPDIDDLHEDYCS
jgi:hypothetical protein